MKLLSKSSLFVTSFLRAISRDWCQVSKLASSLRTSYPGSALPRPPDAGFRLSIPRDGNKKLLHRSFFFEPSLGNLKPTVSVHLVATLFVSLIKIARKVFNPCSCFFRNRCAEMAPLKNSQNGNSLMEPSLGIEPGTSSFAYTPFYKK